MHKTLQLGVLLTVLGLLCFASAWSLNRSNQDTEEQAAEDTAMLLYYLEEAIPMPDLEDSGRGWTLPDELDTTTAAVAIDDASYIGTLHIPTLSLTLPIASEWSLSQAKRTPCRWVGSVQESNLILAGHNYRTHFGRLSNLEQGDYIQFIDCDGQEYWYTVDLLETIEGTDTKSMLDGDWDMTLFTCTYGGANRVTVRCKYAL